MIAEQAGTALPTVSGNDIIFVKGGT